MSKKNYVALHNHSHYSELDGYATIDEYIKAAKDNGMEGIGLTDHGNALGMYEFIKKAQAAGIVPIPGIEFYVAPENPKGAKAKEKIYYSKNQGFGSKKHKYEISYGAYTHMTVFAYNNKGLSNLSKLTSMSWKTENFYFKPRIDTNMLAKHSEGLIVTTGCPSSEVNRRFLMDQDDKAYEYAGRLKSIFGENMYVEIMNHSMEDEELERILMPKLIKLAKDLDLPLIATNDSHYAFKKDAFPHERILSIGTNQPMTEAPFHEGGKRFAFSTDEYYIKSYEEMLEVYPEEVAEKALANTVEIMNKCKGITLDYDTHLRPEIEIPEGYSPATYLQKLIYEGFEKKRGGAPLEVQEESKNRIQEEFHVLHSNDFISYFLVVHDYLDYAHKNNIGIGAGRGSVGGSEIAYLLDISNTDPIRFELLFERFLSPGRGSLYQIDYMSGEIEETPASRTKRRYADNGDSEIVYVHDLYAGDIINHNGDKKEVKRVFVKRPGAAPDVDTDIHTQGREDVIQYCVEKYGKYNVANIGTLGTFKAKKALKAVAKAYNIPYAKANQISSQIPGAPGAEVSINDLTDPTSGKYSQGAEFRRLTEEGHWPEIVDVASQLDGRVSSTSVHPCGVIISNTPIHEGAPTMVRQEDEKIVTQWEYPELEALGYIKMDFLGLELIDTVQQTVENIKLSNEGVEDKNKLLKVPNLRELIQGPMDDKETFKTLSRAETIGIFQLGRDGVRDLLPKVKPERFMEIAIITSLYRPGPISSGAHLQYANRKNGLEEISYIHKDFEGTEVQEILEETLGLLVFQEQTMLIAGRYAGMTPYETDKLRSAIGKKKMDVMMEMKPKFIDGCKAKGASQEAIDTLWNMIEAFGEYGFNKSHAVSYAINIYQSVYLKTHYPKEFMAALIQQSFGSPNKTRKFIQEAVRMKLNLGHVDINNSQVQMASTGVETDSKFDIVFGFSGVRGLNEELSKAIVEERVENGEYKSTSDFVKRIVPKAKLTAAPLASLALAGAFDRFGDSRKLISEKANLLISASKKKAKKGGSLFDISGTADSGIASSIEIKGEELDYNELIQLEADKLGMFVSGHPTERLGHVAKGLNATTLEKVLESNGKNEYNVLGTITNQESKTLKNGNKRIAVILDDGETTQTTYLPKSVSKRIVKAEEIERLAKARAKGVEPKKTKRSEMLLEIVNDESIKALDPIEENEPYLFKVSAVGWGDRRKIKVVDIKKLDTAPDGSLPYEFNVENQEMENKVKGVIKKHYDKNGTYLKVNKNNESAILGVRIKLTIDFIMDLEKVVGKKNIIVKEI